MTRSGRAGEPQARASVTKIVKAFNTVFARHMTAGKVKSGPIGLIVMVDGPEAGEAGHENRCRRLL